MKKHVPYFNFYPTDFMNGVRGLSAQEVGVYTMLLCRIYEEGGPIEFHSSRLSTYCGMREKTFMTVVQKLVELGKFYMSENTISNRRAEAEISSRSDKLKNSSEGGKAKAQKSQQNQSETSSALTDHYCQAEAEAEADKSKLSSLPKNAAAQVPEDLQDKLISALGKTNIQGVGVFDQSSIIGLIAGGVDLETDILPTLRSRAKTLKRPIKSWSYFTDAITDAYNRRIDAGKGLITKPDETDEGWNKRLEFARSRKVWDTANLGPIPGSPGCKAPQHLLKATDGAGWRDLSERKVA